MTPRSEFAISLAKQTIYLMGASFILGSLFTIFVLLIMEMIQRSHLQGEETEIAAEEEAE